MIGQLKDLDKKARHREDQIMYMKREIENSKNANGTLMQSNGTLQAEIDSMSSHIRVVSHQNEELTREIDSFVAANEKIRGQLDKKSRVD